VLRYRLATDRRDLVEQGLKQMMVASIDQHDVCGCTREGFGRRHAAKAGTDDYDLRTSWRHLHFLKRIFQQS
jgi:hypothetical protein